MLGHNVHMQRTNIGKTAQNFSALNLKLKIKHLKSIEKTVNIV